MALALSLTAPAAAQTPTAGSIIGNQASATYTDASNQSKTATSNLVQTTVLPVGSYTLTQANTKTAAIGNTVYMPHTLTNTGNSSDSFELSLTDNAGTFAATNLAIYLDANGDGLPDTTTPLCAGVAACTNYTTPSLPAGGVFRFVISMSIPGGATAAQSDSVTVTAVPSTPAIYTTTSLTNLDTLTVTGSAAFQMVKSISSSQGPTGVVLTYTLTYTNIGAATGNLALSDVIGTGATVGYSYVAGSARWSAGNSTLNDNVYAAGTPDATVGGMDAHYQATTAGAVTTLLGTVTNIGPNVTGAITFQVNVLATAAVGSSQTTNTALYGTDTDTDPTNNTLTSPTNPSPYNVLASRSVVFNDGTASAADGNNARPAVGDTDATPNADLLRVATAAPGATLTFNNVVWNTGNTSDTFNVTSLAAAGGGGYGTWPAGTTIQLFKSDGGTPLLDTNGDGVPDTGSVAAGASYTVVVRVTVPPNACAGGTCPTGPFDVELTAASVGDPAQSNKTYDRLGAISAPVVDLANSSGAVDSAVNQDPIGGTPTTTNAVLPGQSTTFSLFVRNESTIADTYAISSSGTNAFGPTTALPAGWTLEFRASAGGTCAAPGSVITSVGPVAAGAETLVCAVVAVPTGAAAGTTNVFFQATSQVTGATDTKWDAVTVTAVNRLTLAPSNTGQVYPGGTVVYAHTLTNTGNTSCAANYTFNVTQSQSAAGFTFVVYRDVNGDGVIDAGDTVISGPLAAPATLAAGAEIKLLVKVFAPAGAAAGTSDLVTITATATCGGAATTTNAVTDTTTIVTGQVRLVKTQALDATCAAANQAAADALTYTANPLTAKPGACLVYKVIATNEGLGQVSALTISDALPAYTTPGVVLVPNPICSTGTAAYAAPTFSCSGISLAPAQSATLTFSVRVQP